jgi:hypothetical protein
VPVQHARHNALGNLVKAKKESVLHRAICLELAGLDRRRASPVLAEREECDGKDSETCHAFDQDIRAVKYEPSDKLEPEALGEGAARVNELEPRVNDRVCLARKEAWEQQIAHLLNQLDERRLAYARLVNLVRGNEGPLGPRGLGGLGGPCGPLGPCGLGGLGGLGGPLGPLGPCTNGIGSA